MTSKPHITPDEIGRLVQTARLWLDEVYGDTSHSALDEIEQAFTSLYEQLQAERREEWREGIVNVLDHEGNYLGCMGSETWKWTLDGGIERLKEQLEALTERNQFLSTEIVRLEIVIRAAIEMGLDHPDALETLHAALRLSNPANDPHKCPSCGGNGDAAECGSLWHTSRTASPAKTPQWDSAEFERNSKAVKESDASVYNQDTERS